jgi:NAD(P)-dependent dehydrogenase (short-subunit alcohol dehydrogenase family)
MLSYNLTAMTSKLIQPYASVHETPKGPGDARPTAMTVISDEKLENKWLDKTALITGASSGIGIETTRALHATGARIFMTTRNLEAAKKVRSDILASSLGKGEIEILHMELDDLESVKSAAQEFLKKSNQLNILINNAGVMYCPEGETKQGFETHWGTNHLAHFLLTQLLLPILITSSTPSFASRVVNVSSLGHHHAPGGLTIEAMADLDFSKSPYNKTIAYGRSKCANILHANQIERLYGSDPDHPIHAFSLHPGAITTNLWRHVDGTPEAMFQDIWKNTEQGAATSVWCAVAGVWEGKGGRYCEDVGEAGFDGGVEGYKLGDPGYAAWAYDEKGEKRLWDASLESVQGFFE